jgi:hypothetical protein
MADKTKKSEGLSCACGKVDLYEEWIKLNEKKEEEVSDSISSNQADDHASSADDAGKENQKRFQTKK